MKEERLTVVLYMVSVTNDGSMSLDLLDMVLVNSFVYSKSIEVS